MSEVELILLNNSDKCTVYTIQFLGDELNEFNKFVKDMSLHCKNLRSCSNRV